MKIKQRKKQQQQKDKQTKAKHNRTIIKKKSIASGKGPGLNHRSQFLYHRVDDLCLVMCLFSKDLYTTKFWADFSGISKFLFPVVVPCPFTFTPPVFHQRLWSSRHRVRIHFFFSFELAKWFKVHGKVNFYLLMHKPENVEKKDNPQGCLTQKTQSLVLLRCRQRHF